MSISRCLTKVLLFLACCAGVSAAQLSLPDSLRTPLNITFKGFQGDTAVAINGLRHELAAILPQTKYKKMTAACKVVFFEPDNRLHPIYAVNPDDPVLPASVEKLFTTSATLWALGSDYKFSTRLDLLPSARVEDSAVIGNVYLRPSGDPTLSLWDFDTLADRLLAAGITRIEGDIVSDLSEDQVLTPDAKKYLADHVDVPTFIGGGDSSAIDEAADSTSEDSNDEESDSPGFRSSSPNFFIGRNVITVRVTAGTHKGAPVHVSVNPPIANIRIVNRGSTSAAAKTIIKRVRVGKGRHKRWKTVRIHTNSVYTIHLSTSADASDPEQTVVVSGLLPAGLTRVYNIPISNVPQTMAGLLKWRLEQNGIRVTGTARSGEPPRGFGGYKLLAEKQTPLLSLLQVTNKRSDNYLAESMFRKLSSIADVSATNPIERSRKLIRSWLNVLNVNCTNGMCWDGSGISRNNQTTASTVIDLLHGIRTRSKMYNDFVSTMSIAGVDGTTRGRMINTPAQFNARSKTGTLNGVTALAGYVSTQDGQLAAYFITMQHFGRGARAYKGIQDQIVRKLASFRYADYIAKYAPEPDQPKEVPGYTAPSPTRPSGGR